MTSEIAAASAQEACDSQDLFEHRAILCTSDNKPFSEVNELYQGAGFSVFREFDSRQDSGVHNKTAELSVMEVQADELQTIVGDKEHPMWIFTRIGLWSRLWPSTVVGRQSYRNTLILLQDVAGRMNLERVPLIVTDGFAFTKKAVVRVFGPACLYGQVIKTCRNDRIVKVERRALIGDAWRLEGMLRDSEDSSKLNTSFVERLNLTIRQGSAYVFRRTICHASFTFSLSTLGTIMVRQSAVLTCGIARTPQIDAAVAPSGDSFAATLYRQRRIR